MREEIVKRNQRILLQFHQLPSQSKENIYLLLFLDPLCSAQVSFSSLFPLLLTSKGGTSYRHDCSNGSSIQKLWTVTHWNDFLFNVSGYFKTISRAFNFW